MDNYENTQGLNASDFLGSYLRKEDILGETVVRIIDVRGETLPGAGRPKLVAYFEGIQKGLVLNSTNIKRLVHYFGTSNTARWRGDICLYVDDNVEYAGTLVGGLRVKPATVNGGATVGSPAATPQERYAHKMLDNDIV